jgi:hypothetical protein
LFLITSAIFCYTVFLTARSEEAGGRLIWPVVTFFFVYLGAFVFWGCRVEEEHH